MTHKKGLGSSHSRRNSNTQRLGVKRFSGQTVNVDEILMCQSGIHYHPGFNIGIGKDGTLFTLEKDAIESGRHRNCRIISVKEAV